LGRNNSISFSFSDYVKNKPFREVLPWIGGDLQTLRDTFVIDFGKSKQIKKYSFRLIIFFLKNLNMIIFLDF